MSPTVVGTPGYKQRRLSNQSSHYFKRQVMASIRLNFHQESLQLFANATRVWAGASALTAVSAPDGGIAAAAIDVARSRVDTVARMCLIIPSFEVQ